MKGYRFTPQAFDDLFGIWSYSAQDNPGAADGVEQAIYTACERLAESPLMGSVRKDLTPLPVRFRLLTPYPNYFVVYDPAATPLQVIRILHRARNIRTLLPEPRLA